MKKNLAISFGVVASFGFGFYYVYTHIIYHILVALTWFVAQ